MTNGKPCGRPDGHTGQHRAPGSLERRRELERERYAASPEFRSRQFLLREIRKARKVLAA